MFQNVRRPALLATCVAAGLLLAGCSIHGLHMAQSPLLRFLAPTSGRIAYIGTDGNVHIASQNGRVIDVTKDGQVGSNPTVSYTAPSWSFDGKEIAYGRVAGGSAAKKTGSGVFVAGANGSRAREVFASKGSVPFYLSWSPHGSRIAVLSQAAGSEGALEVGVVGTNPRGAGRRAPSASYISVERGAPFYWVWAPDGRMLIAHTQAGTTKNAEDFIELYRLGGEAGAPRAEQELRGALGAFDAPAISPNGRELLVPIGSGRESNLVLWNLRTGAKQSIARILGSVSYAFSPNGRYVAYVDHSGAKGGATLHVVRPGEVAEIFTVSTGHVLSFWWSPNSAEIAYVTPANVDPGSLDPAFDRNGNLTVGSMNVVNVRTRQSWVVSRYPLTAAFLNSAPFNDQYQRSSTIWSPNGTYLLFTAVTSSGDPGIFVATADGNLKPDLLAYGDFASWSWR